MTTRVACSRRHRLEELPTAAVRAAKKGDPGEGRGQGALGGIAIRTHAVFQYRVERAVRLFKRGALRLLAMLASPRGWSSHREDWERAVDGFRWHALSFLGARRVIAGVVDCADLHAATPPR